MSIITARRARLLRFNVGAVTTDVETDCSAPARVCCAYAGIPVADFNTATGANALLKTCLCSHACRIEKMLQEGINSLSGDGELMVTLPASLPSGRAAPSAT